MNSHSLVANSLGKSGTHPYSQDRERVEWILNDALQGKESDEESRSLLRTKIEAELGNHRKYFEK